MALFDYFPIWGFCISLISYSVMIGSLVKHFIDLRILVPRLFNEYKQNELTENLAKLDKSLVSSAQRIFFSGFFIGIGLFMYYVSVL